MFALCRQYPLPFSIVIYFAILPTDAKYQRSPPDPFMPLSSKAGQRVGKEIENLV